MVEVERDEFFDKGAVSAQGPAGLDRVAPGEEADAAVSAGVKFVEQAADAAVMIHVDAIERPGAVLIDQRDDGVAGLELVHHGDGEGVYEHYAVPDAASRAQDVGVGRIGEVKILGADEVEIEAHVLHAGKLGQTVEQLLTGVAVVGVLEVGQFDANHHAEGQAFGGGAGAIRIAFLLVAVAEAGGEGEDLGAGLGVDAGVIGETPRHGGAGKFQAVGDQLLIDFSHGRLGRAMN
ncbi:MAG: hypothetical protein MUE42_15530 [Opitutaceae bacterium]|nr:hypothetical protein [Opitutaceae bacterium]